MTPAAPVIALYGRTYWDAELEVDLASLGSGKGKRDATLRTVVGGWACNAAWAIGGRFPAGAIRVVTVTSWLDWPRLQAGLPEGVTLDAIFSPDTARDMPPISVIINPSGACRLLRDPQAQTDDLWQVDRVSLGATLARVHLLGRLPPVFAAGVLACSRASGATFAWCGGASLPLELERDVDILCVNSAEAAQLLGSASATPRDAAEALLRRARAPGAVRVVTGGGAAPTTAAMRDGQAVRFHQAPPPAVPAQQVTRLKGAGDTFAACFVAAACFTPEGAVEPRPQVERALHTAQAMTARFISQGSA